MLFYPPPEAPPEPFGISLRHNLQILLNTMRASVKCLLASSVL